MILLSTNFYGLCIKFMLLHLIRFPSKKLELYSLIGLKYLIEFGIMGYLKEHSIICHDSKMWLFNVKIITKSPNSVLS